MILLTVKLSCRREGEGTGKEPLSTELLLSGGCLPCTISCKCLPCTISPFTGDSDQKGMEIKQDSITSPKSHSLQVTKVSW